MNSNPVDDGVLRALSGGIQLIDGEVMARRHPNTFRLLGREARERLSPGDYAKIGVPGERFWVEVYRRTEKGYLGRIRNDVRRVGDLTYGDEIAFGPRHVLDVDVRWRARRHRR